jgi:hypothetical protein
LRGIQDGVGQMCIPLHSSIQQQVGRLSEHARKRLGFSAGEKDMRAATCLIKKKSLKT